MSALYDCRDPYHEDDWCRFWAESAEDAACLYAEANEVNGYYAYDGQGRVLVRCLATGEESTWVMSGEIQAVYYARRDKDGLA